MAVEEDSQREPSAGHVAPTSHTAAPVCLSTPTLTPCPESSWFPLGFLQTRQVWVAGRTTSLDVLATSVVGIIP